MSTSDVITRLLADCDAAVAREPLDLQPLEARARFRALHCEDKSLAVADCRAVLQLRLQQRKRKASGVLAQGRVWLGRALANGSGTFRFYFLAQAIAHFDVAAVGAPKNATIYRDRAVAWAHLKQRESAQSDFAQMRALRGETPQSWRVEAETFALPYATDIEAAAAAYRRLIELKTGALTLQICLRRARAKNTPNLQRLAYLDLATEIAPVAIDPLVERAAWWMQKGDREKADADWQRALELRPDEPAIYEARARSTARGDGFERAVADYETALRLRIAANGRLGTTKRLRQRAGGLKTHANGLRDGAQIFAVYSVAIERDPRCAMLSVLRAAITRRMFDFADDDPFADEDEAPHPMVQSALEDEMRALWLDGTLKTPRTALVKHFARHLAGATGHETLEGLMETRRLLASKGLKARLVAKIVAEIEAKLCDT